MSEAKHTPGPWRVVGDYEAGFYVERDTDDADEHPTVCCLSCDDAPEPEIVEADARLIAAAPKLLAALKRFVAYGNIYRCRIYEQSPYEQALQAIAKAEGNDDK